MPKRFPVFARCLFWDVDFDKLDYEVNRDFIIERVFSWGDIPDVRQARRYYGDEMVLEVLLVAPGMPSFPLHLWSVVFERPLNDFASIRNETEIDPSVLKRNHFKRANEIHGLPPWPEPDPAILRMS